MKKSVEACIVLAGMIILLGTGFASSYEFGSRVRAGDTDVNDALINVSLAVGFMDLPPFSALPDPKDAAYLHQGTLPGAILPGDIRLSPFAGFPAGTRVQPTDPDAGKAIIPFPKTANWAFSALFDGVPPQPVDIDDPVYWAINAGSRAHSVADLRLSKIQSLIPGTWMKDSDLDFNNPIKLLNVSMMIRDLDGSGLYSGSDPVYLKIYNITATEVQPGDLRLTPINGHS